MTLAPSGFNGISQAGEKYSVPPLSSVCHLEDIRVLTSLSRWSFHFAFLPGLVGKLLCFHLEVVSALDLVALLDQLYQLQLILMGGRK